MSAFRLPDLGEGLPEAEIVQWHVKVGDEIAVDQLLVSMETAKAVVDVPSPVAGVISALGGELGDVIRTGEVLVSFVEPESVPAPTPTPTPGSTPIPGSTPSSPLAAEQAERPVPDADMASDGDAGTVVGRIGSTTPQTQPDQFWLADDETQLSAQAPETPALEMPQVRLLARELGVELEQITGSGANGQVLAEDVYTAAQQQPGRFERLTGARKAMLQAMTQSQQQVALTTLQDEADISQWPQAGDLTVRVLQAIAVACAAEPALNAWFYPASQSRRLFDTVHVGVAVDAEHGLYVPVLAQVESKSAQQLRQALADVKQLVAQRRLPAPSVAATISLSNFGAIGGRFATPMVSPPQVAILGVGRVFSQPALTAEGWQTRRCLPLSLSFDHRCCTGGEASRFMRALVDSLQ